MKYQNVSEKVLHLSEHRFASPLTIVEITEDQFTSLINGYVAAKQLVAVEEEPKVSILQNILNDVESTVVTDLEQQVLKPHSESDPTLPPTTTDETPEEPQTVASVESPVVEPTLTQTESDPSPTKPTVTPKASTKKASK